MNESDRIITLYQPWASAIARGFKKVETRSWAYPQKYLGGDLFIHAGIKRPNLDTINLLDWYLEHSGTPNAFNWDSMPFGAVICRAKVLSCQKITESLIDESLTDFNTLKTELAWGHWSPGRWAWYLELLESFEDNPVPLKGRQGLYPVPLEVYDR